MKASSEWLKSENVRGFGEENKWVKNRRECGIRANDGLKKVNSCMDKERETNKWKMEDGVEYVTENG